MRDETWYWMRYHFTNNADGIGRIAAFFNAVRALGINHQREKACGYTIVHVWAREDSRANAEIYEETQEAPTYIAEGLSN